MKTILILAFLFCTACGEIDKLKGSSSNVSLEPFNYDCTYDDSLSEEGFHFYLCTERDTQRQCEVVLGPNEYFNDSTCDDFNFESFEQYLKDGNK